MAFAFDFQGAQVIVNDPFIDRDERGGSQLDFLTRLSGELGIGWPPIPSHIKQEDAFEGLPASRRSRNPT